MKLLKKMIQWLLFLFLLFMTLGCALDSAPVAAVLFMITGMICSPWGKKAVRILKPGAKGRHVVLLGIAFLFASFGAMMGTADLASDDAAEPTKPVTETNTSELQVHYIDVGQGDATLIVCDGEAMLIDAGDNSKGTTVQFYLQKQGVTSLKYMIGTHPDADHIGGMDVIITKFDCDTIMMPDKESDSATYRDVIDAMNYKGYKNTLPVVGNTYPLGSATFTIIAPNQPYSDTNNCSIGIILVHGNNKFLFTGDAEMEAEDDILNNGIDIAADVLKVGHHGSSTSTGEAFLKAVAPEYAVISCGVDNSYGHPHEETLAALKNAGVQIFRTDEQGSIIAASDGKRITWNADSSDSWKAGAVAEENAQTASVESSRNDSDENAGKENNNLENNSGENDNDGNDASVKYSSSVSAKNSSSEAAEIITPQEPDEEPVPEETVVSAQEPVDATAGAVTYVLNNNTKKFHYPDCYSAKKIKDSNREETTMTREEIIAKGYDPCKNCNP